MIASIGIYGGICAESHIAPLWKMDSTERKILDKQDIFSAGDGRDEERVEHFGDDFIASELKTQCVTYLNMWKQDCSAAGSVPRIEYKPISLVGDDVFLNGFYADERTFIYETTDNNMKFIENTALYILALNTGIIVYWIAQYKSIFNDFRTNHGAKNANGERNGKPRNQLCFRSEKFIGLNRFIILVKFLSKIIIPFVDSITGKSNQHTLNF